MNLTLRVCLWGLSVVASGCAWHGPKGDPLTGSGWRLIELEGLPASASANTEVSPSLRFDATGNRVFGAGGCNGMNGTYTRSGFELRFGEFVMTRRRCSDDALNRQENAFVRVLSAVDRYDIKAEVLTLYSGGTARARFARLESPVQ